MSKTHSGPTRCRNEGCPRPVEPGENYCAPCGLERSLFRRDARIRSAETRTERETGARGR
jgi:hypothetical protein